MAAKQKRSLSCLTDAKELHRVKGGIVTDTSTWMLEVTCLIRSGQHPVPGTSTEQEAREECRLMSEWTSIKIRQSVRAGCGKQPPFWPRSSFWDRERSHHETVSPPPLVTGSYNLTCLPLPQAPLSGQWGFNSREVACLVANWLHWRYSSNGTEIQKKEQRSSPSISNNFFYHAAPQDQSQWFSGSLGLRTKSLHLSFHTC